MGRVETQGLKKERYNRSEGSCWRLLDRDDAMSNGGATIILTASASASASASANANANGSGSGSGSGRVTGGSASEKVIFQ